MPVLEQTYPDVRNYIGGTFVDASDRKMLDITNPATGNVISKEAAGAWAKEVLDPRHHPIVDDGLAWWRGEPSGRAAADTATRARATGELVLAVADAARRLNPRR